jgi:hypothetical protein
VHDRVAGAVEHEGTALGRLGRELAHEPALAGARLAADQRDASALAVRPWNQRPEHRQLTRAPDERERRPQAQRARERRHSQI